MPRTLDGQITMEKTPSYFVTREAPARISAMSKDTKLLVVVRDPVTRAVSDYTQTLSKRPDIPSFESLAFRNRSAGLVDRSWSAIQIGLYAEHLERWLRHFPARQMLFVSGERLVRDPAGELGRVQDFLGLKRIISDKHFYFNQTKGFPCLKKAEGSGRPHCLGKTKGRPHPEIDAQVLRQLRDFYRPFNRKFYQMTGHDFGWDGWTYNLKRKKKISEDNIFFYQSVEKKQFNICAADICFSIFFFMNVKEIVLLSTLTGMNNQPQRFRKKKKKKSARISIFHLYFMFCVHRYEVWVSVTIKTLKKSLRV